jgi:hypothetical protein
MFDASFVILTNKEGEKWKIGNATKTSLTRLVEFGLNLEI